MKTSSCFVLLLLSISISMAAAAEAPAAPVIDIDGKPVRSGTGYYILPVIRGRGGGLTLGSRGNRTCPLDVVQERLEVKRGLPLSFHPIDGKKGAVVRISTDHNIKFSASSSSSICVQSSVWKLDLDESIQKYVISTGGVEGNPGSATVSNWFKIERYDSSSRDYKLFFCPTVCDFCKVICRDVGVLIEDGVRRLTLSLTDDIVPFRLHFKKAT